MFYKSIQISKLEVSWQSSLNNVSYNSLCRTSSQANLIPRYCLPNLMMRKSRSYVPHVTHKPTFFRVSGLPTGPSATVSAYITAAVRQQCSSNETVNKLDVVTLPSCYDHQQSSSVALLRFQNGIPDFLTDLIADPLDSLHIPTPDSDTSSKSITIDRHFHGFTQLYHTDPAQEVAAE